MEKGGRHCFRSVYLDACTVFVMTPPTNEHTKRGEGETIERGVPYHANRPYPVLNQASAHSSPSGAGRWSSQTLLLRRKHVMALSALVYMYMYERLRCERALAGGFHSTPLASPRFPGVAS